MKEEMAVVQPEELKELVVKKLTEVEMPAEDARTVADVLVYADLRGTHSHGVLRTEHYANRVRKGGMNLHAELKLTMLKPAVGLVDGAGGVGHVAAKFATRHSIELAKEHGMALVGVKNSSHCGALAYYVNMALEEKFAAVVLGNTDKAVVPFGGSSRFFGTNPFAFGMPGKNENVLLDMATSEVAFGKIYYAQENDTPIPEGWAVDEEGKFTTDPHKALALFPFGGAKGYGINMMVEALSGILIGGVFGPYVKPMYEELESYRNLSTFHLVIDPTLFTGDAVYGYVQRMIDELHAQPAAPGFERVLIPGEREDREMQRSLKEGVTIQKSVYEYLLR
ncbi:MAG: Ldh family oxidoreductase [Spirochaetaceae bacterium]